MKNKKDFKKDEGAKCSVESPFTKNNFASATDQSKAKEITHRPSVGKFKTEPLEMVFASKHFINKSQNNDNRQINKY